MSKMLEATCVSGVVTSEGVPVPSADILSEGVGESDGILILDEDKAKYITSTAQDLKAVIDKMSDILDQVSSLVASIPNDTIFIPGSGGASLIFPPGFSANKALLDTAISELDAMKEVLR